MSDQYYTLEEVMKQLGKSRSTVLRDAKEGLIAYELEEGKTKGRLSSLGKSYLSNGCKSRKVIPFLLFEQFALILLQERAFYLGPQYFFLPNPHHIKE